MSIPKCKNIVLNSLLSPKGIFRRTEKTRYPTTKNRLKKQYTEEAKHITEQSDLDPLTGPQAETTCEKKGYPFALPEHLKRLEITKDTHFTPDERFKSIVTKASVRQGILAKVTNSRRELEAGLLHIACIAVIGSLLRYALVVTGSVIPPALVKKMNT